MSMGCVTLLIIPIVISLCDASIILKSTEKNGELQLPSMNYRAPQEGPQEEVKKSAMDLIRTRLDVMEKDMDSLKRENENQKQEIVQMKSVVQYLLNLLHSGGSSTGQVVDNEFLGLSSKSRSARSTTVDGKGTNTTETVTSAQPRKLSKDFFKLRDKVSGLDATFNASLGNVNDEITSLKVKLNLIEVVVDKINGDVKGLGATHNASLFNVNKDLANSKVRMNVIEYLVDKLNGEVKELGQVKRKRSSSKTPPSSCHELSVMGHYLDGLYAIKDKATKKVQTVYCQFDSSAVVHQELVGNLHVNTKSVHFYVQRNNWYGEIGTAIPFEVERLNEGGAFDLKSGVFKAPVPGIYHFQFSGVKRGEEGSVHRKLSVFLRVNGEKIGFAHTFQQTAESYDVVSLSASLRLKAGDRVILHLYNGELYEYPGDHFTHFTGWLVEEDLV